VKALANHVGTWRVGRESLGMTGKNMFPVSLLVLDPLPFALFILDLFSGSATVDAATVVP
jgi:hypothetical protein